MSMNNPYATGDADRGVGYTAPVVGSAPATTPDLPTLEQNLIEAQRELERLQKNLGTVRASERAAAEDRINNQFDTIARIQHDITLRDKPVAGTNQAEAGLYASQAANQDADAALRNAQAAQVGKPSGDALLQAQSSAASTAAVNSRTAVDAGIASLRADVDREGLALKDKELSLTNQWKGDQISLERWKVEMENAQRDYDRAVQKLKIAVDEKAVAQRQQEAEGNQAVQREATASTANNQRVASATQVGTASGQLADNLLKGLAPSDAVQNVLRVLGGADPNSIVARAGGVDVSHFDPYEVVGGAAARERQALGFTAPTAAAPTTAQSPLIGQPVMPPAVQPQLQPAAQQAVDQAAAGSIDGTDIHPDSTLIYDLMGANA